MKEKGFINDFCRKYYNYGPENWHSPLLDEISNFPCNHNFYDGKCSAPTHQMALKWLREVHKLHIYAKPYWSQGDMRNKMSWQGFVVDLNTINGDSQCYADSPEEAIENRIRFVLENLI